MKIPVYKIRIDYDHWPEGLPEHYMRIGLVMSQGSILRPDVEYDWHTPAAIVEKIEELCQRNPRYLNHMFSKFPKDLVVEETEKAMPELIKMGLISREEVYLTKHEVSNMKHDLFASEEQEQNQGRTYL